MSVETTRTALYALERAHRDDRDGGYGLAAAFCEYRNQMPADAAGEWDEVLLGWVQAEHGRFWGVALEALARAGSAKISEDLAAMLRGPARSTEWREHVINTLIRRGFHDSALIADVEQAAKRMTPLGLPNLAALLARVPQLFNSCAACIVDLIAAGRLAHVEANVPPFVYAAADSEPEVLLRLVQQISLQNNDAGQQFGTMVIEYLEKPFVQRSLGREVANEMIVKLRRLSNTR